MPRSTAYVPDFRRARVSAVNIPRYILRAMRCSCNNNAVATPRLTDVKSRENLQCSFRNSLNGADQLGGLSISALLGNNLRKDFVLLIDQLLNDLPTPATRSAT
jgi:hypothetical protein